MTNIMLWPDLQREDGHWLPAVNLAKSLTDVGYNVQAMGIPDTEAIVAPYQINFVKIMEELFPLGHALKRLEEGGGPPEHLMPLARGELDGVFNGATPPDVLIAGYFAAFEALILHHKYQVPLVVLTTFLRHPDLSPASAVHQTLLDLPPALVDRLLDLSMPNEPKTIETFLAPLETAPEILPMAEEFDFKDSDWQHLGPVTYVEPMIQRIRMDGSALPTPTVNYFHPLPPTGDVLYGACGSQVEVFEGSARNFFVSLIEMMKAPSMASKHLVLSLGRKLNQQFLREYTSDGSLGTKILPTNVSFADWVPQQEILQRSEVAFIHGGLATIKEAIREDVPIVIVPMVNDQFDNALRIEEGELGVMVEVQRLTANNLRSAYVEATTGAWFSRSVSKLRQSFIDAENRVPRRSVEIVQGIALP